MPGKFFTGHVPMPGKIRVRERPQIAVPGKDHANATEKRGWIEYARRGTKNPKRYAYRRRWIRDSAGNWVKSNPKRLKSIRPLTEEEYVRRITGEGRDAITGRKRRDRSD